MFKHCRHERYRAIFFESLNHVVFLVTFFGLVVVGSVGADRQSCKLLLEVYSNEEHDLDMICKTYNITYNTCYNKENDLRIKSTLTFEQKTIYTYRLTS